MPYRIQIVLYGNAGWIIEALARQWSDLLSNGVPGAEVNLEMGGPRQGADAYVHMTYLKARPVQGARNVVLVTHINRWWHAMKVLALSAHGAEFVVMSRQTQALVDDYVGRPAAACVNPRSIHFARTAGKRSLTFGLFFRLYGDDRKSRSSILGLLALAERAPHASRLVMYGRGLPDLCGSFPNANVDASDAEFEVAEYERRLRECDYVVYFGHDEGSMSVADACALGIPVLATAQGFHLDLALPAGSQLFVSAQEVVEAAWRLCAPLGESGCTDDPSALFSSARHAADPRRVSLWRYLRVPLVRNPFLLRGDNLRSSVKYAYRRIRSRLDESR